MQFRLSLTILSVIFLFNSVYSQFDNTFFDSDFREERIDSSHIQFHLDNLNYFRNTEYTTMIDKGSTYPGFHLLPYAQYQFNSNAVIYGGLFFRYDFGNSRVKQLDPYLKFKYRLWGHDLIFGNLEGGTQHRLIEPMYDYERMITDRWEQGIQIRRANKAVEYDFWIDWQNMIYENDAEKEIMFAGINLNINPILTDKTKLSLNAQGHTYHAAGELDSTTTPNSMEYNFALGGSFRHTFNKNTSLCISGHAAYYYDHGQTFANGFANGNGSLAVAQLKIHEYEIVLTYWDAYRFQSPVGERLYHSVGRKNGPANPYDYRKMVSLRIANEIKITEGLVFYNRLGVSYNIDHNKTDVIMENYLRWHLRSKSKEVRLY